MIEYEPIARFRFVAVCAVHGLLGGKNQVEEAFMVTSAHQQEKGCPKVWIQTTDNYLAGQMNAISRALVRFKQRFAIFNSNSET